jgi:MerR family transcriptional regulator/heat shock protein HspR
MINRQDPPRYYRLSAAATLAGISDRRLRVFIRYGLIRPARFEGRQMFFGDEEIIRLRRIRRLSDDLGLNLAGIEVTLRLLDRLERVRADLAIPDDPPVIVSTTHGAAVLPKPRDSDRGGRAWPTK